MKHFPRWKGLIIYKKRRKAINNIQSRQKPKRNNTTAIPNSKGIILKKEAARFNLNIPLKPCPNTFHHIKSDRDPVNPFDTAGIYKIEYKMKIIKKVVT